MESERNIKNCILICNLSIMYAKAEISETNKLICPFEQQIKFIKLQADIDCLLAQMQVIEEHKMRSLLYVQEFQQATMPKHR